jgi:hypothetical protein
MKTDDEIINEVMEDDIKKIPRQLMGRVEPGLRKTKEQMRKAIKIARTNSLETALEIAKEGHLPNNVVIIRLQEELNKVGI